jgi:hypothetical protein
VRVIAAVGERGPRLALRQATASMTAELLNLTCETYRASQPRQGRSNPKST